MKNHHRGFKLFPENEPQATTEKNKKMEPRRFISNPDFILREIAGESVLVPVGEAGIFENSVISLNESCSFLWKLFEVPRTVEEVIAEAKKEYSDPDGLMEAQIRKFTEDYLNYGLLKEER